MLYIHTPDGLHGWLYNQPLIRRHKYWTQEDQDLLVFLRSELSLPNWAIARLLNRTNQAIIARIHYTKLGYRQVKKTSWLTPSTGSPSAKITRRGVEHAKLPTRTLAYTKKNNLWNTRVGR